MIKLYVFDNNRLLFCPDGKLLPEQVSRFSAIVNKWHSEGGVLVFPVPFELVDMRSEAPLDYTVTISNICPEDLPPLENDEPDGLTERLNAIASEG